MVLIGHFNFCDDWTESNEYPVSIVWFKIGSSKRSVSCDAAQKTASKKNGGEARPSLTHPPYFFACLPFFALRRN